jgi:hypothetical protein
MNIILFVLLAALCYGAGFLIGRNSDRILESIKSLPSFFLKMCNAFLVTVGAISYLTGTLVMTSFEFLKQNFKKLNKEKTV